MRSQWKKWPSIQKDALSRFKSWPHSWVEKSTYELQGAMNIASPLQSEIIVPYMLLIFSLWPTYFSSLYDLDLRPTATFCVGLWLCIVSTKRNSSFVSGIGMKRLMFSHGRTYQLPPFSPANSINSRKIDLAAIIRASEKPKFGRVRKFGIHKSKPFPCHAAPHAQQETITTTLEMYSSSSVLNLLHFPSQFSIWIPWPPLRSKVAWTIARSIKIE